MRYSYQSHDLVEHGGGTLGFITQIARFPTDNLGIITLSNEYTSGGPITEAVKFRIADEILGLKETDWNDRWVPIVAQTLHVQYLIDSCRYPKLGS